MLGWALRRLRHAYPDAPLVAVVAAKRLTFWRRTLASELPEVGVVAGGERRQDSVRAGVAATDPSRETVLIHDGARPLVHVDDIRSVVNGLGEAAGAILCAPLAETVKRVAADGTVDVTVPRETLRLAQTPQVFRRAALERGWAECDLEREWTDESAMLEELKMAVRLVAARHLNPKLTTAADLAVLEALAGAGQR